MYAITNRLLNKSLKIMKMATSLDLEIFTNVINKYTN